MATQRKVPVTTRALVQRINRALAKDEEQLRKARTAQTAAAVGDFYVVDLRRNVVAYQHVDLEALGRKLGVLQPYETLAD